MGINFDPIRSETPNYLDAKVYTILFGNSVQTLDNTAGFSRRRKFTPTTSWHYLSDTKKEPFFENDLIQFQYKYYISYL